MSQSERERARIRIEEAKWWRHLTFHHQESYFGIEGDKRIDALNHDLTRAALDTPQEPTPDAHDEPTRKALILAKDELREMMLAHKSGNRPRNPEFTQAALEAVEAALAAAPRPALSPDAAASSGDDKGEGR